METALPPAPKSYLLPLTLALIVVASGSLYYYLRVTSPATLTGFSTTISGLFAKVASTTPPPSQADALAQATSTPPPSLPPYILPSGSQTYRFSHGSEVKGPKITLVTINPLDPQAGATQNIVMEVESESPVISATIIASTDNQDHTLNLELTAGDAVKGTYSGTWSVNDSYAQKYDFRYILKNANATYDEVMHIR